jgi:plastocyanin
MSGGAGAGTLPCMNLTRLICLGVLAGTLVPAATAGAQVQPAGTGEPLFTNSAQNTQWLEWPAVSGTDGYRIRFDYYENNALKANPSYPMTNGGTTWVNWSGVAPLQHGGQYGICAQGSYSFPDDDLYVPDGPNSCSMGTQLGRRAYTTIDRSKPAAAMTLAGGATYTRTAGVALKVAFSDDVAGPFPANFLCFQAGGGPSGVCDTAAGAIYGYNTACSVPAGAGKSTDFDCTADYGPGVPDGPVWACVIAADASIPDNPSSADQRQSAEKANLSAPACDSVVVDRTAPAASISASATAVKVGDLVAFQAQASDATSGLGTRNEWAWGDGTAAGSGAAATHTFTQAGTYAVKLTVADKAGNTATATKTITVTAPVVVTPTPTPTPTTTPAPTPAPPAPTPTPSPATGDGDETPEPDAGDDRPAPAPKLDVDAPRRVKARSGVLRVALTAGASGRVQLALVRGGRVIARGGTAVAAGTKAYRLKLPKRAKPGAYALKATYAPDSGAAVSVSRTVRLTGKPAARRARVAAHGAPRLHGGPVALPDGRFHSKRPARTFAVR